MCNFTGDSAFAPQLNLIKRPLTLIFSLILAFSFTFTGCDNGGGGGGGDTILDMAWVKIQGGTFTMGSPTDELGRSALANRETQHQVTLSKDFYIGKYPVTQAQYQEVTGTNPSYFQSNPTSGEVQENRPVENVSWYDAIEFCNKLSEKENLTSVYTITGRTPGTGYPITAATVTADFSKNGYRLPIEAEWEYACRAGTTTAYNTGATINNNTGWYDANSNAMTHEVGKKQSNAWGLYDMHGNVLEWCWDWRGDYSTDAKTDPTGADSGTYRVIRGGGWQNTSAGIRSASRSSDVFSMDKDTGFRVVRLAE